MSKNIAIVLAAGRGSRMNSSIPKQFMMIENRPVLYYSIYAFQTSPVIDEIVLVTSQDEMEYCKKEIVEKYSLDKVSKLVCGGSERYESVYNGLSSVSDDGYVFIHDGARPCITADMIERLFISVKEYNAVVAAVPSKDTVKIADSNGFVDSTPDRNTVWCIQTPQVFSLSEIKKAYNKMYQDGNYTKITDDAMVMERYGDIPVKLEMGSYSNIKITTPEDIIIVKNTFKKNEKNSN